MGDKRTGPAGNGAGTRDLEKSKHQATTLHPAHRAELRALGVTDATIARLGNFTDPTVPGWVVPCTDGKNTAMLAVIDRKHRTPGGSKTLWLPKGQTTFPALLRDVPSAVYDLIVEGPRQALAAAMYAPRDTRVWVMNGCDGLNRKTLDRLAELFADHRVYVMTDGDWRRNDHVAGAATVRLPTLLEEAGAREVKVADVGGIGTDGLDDIILRTKEDQRVELLADILADAKPARDRRLELETDKELIRLQAREQAQRLFSAQTAAVLPEPGGISLAELLAEPDDAPIWRVANLWPADGNIMFSAQRKAGKTTTRDNLIRCLADGDDFLSTVDGFTNPDGWTFSVTPLADGERVYVADLELSRRTLRRWLADHRIAHPERVIVQSFRGRVGELDVLDDSRRGKWSTYLRDNGVRMLILDPLAPLLGAYGYDENDNNGVTRVLAALDALKAEADIAELMVVHHMGHAGERSRGASRLRDWPDAEWFLYREDGEGGREPPPDARRFFAAEGRDVAVREMMLDYDRDTRRLSIAGARGSSTRRPSMRRPCSRS